MERITKSRIMICMWRNAVCSVYRYRARVLKLLDPWNIKSRILVAMSIMVYFSLRL